MISNQYVSNATRGEKVLDHRYSTHKQAYKAIPRPPSDHDAVLLLPIYKQKLKQEVLVTRLVKKWSPETKIMLQDCFVRADLNIL